MNARLAHSIVIGSGSEDIGALTAAQSDSDRNRIAEEHARNRRLDRDAIVFAALERLEASARNDGATSENIGVWVSPYTRSYTGRYIAPDDVASLLAEIRAQLSPLVTR